MPGTDDLTTAGVAGHAPRRTLRVLGVAAALVVAIVAATAVADNRLRAAREDDAEQVLAAVGRGDCVAAAAAYQRATEGQAPPSGRPPIRSDVSDAAAECRTLAAIDVLAGTGDVKALGKYVAFRHSHTESPLREHVPERIGDLIGSGKLRPEPETCLALGALLWQDGEPVRSAETLPPLLLSCGRMLSDGKPPADDVYVAVNLLGAVRQTYPAAKESRPAQRVEAALRVQLAGPESILDTPHRSGANGKLAKVRFLNYGSESMLLAVSGPGGGHVVRIEGCAGCDPAGGTLTFARCERDDAPGTTLTLRPGQYRVAVEYTGNRGWAWWPGEWRLRAGRYIECLGPAA